MTTPSAAVMAAFGRLPARNNFDITARTHAKRCSICKEWLWVENFGADAGRGDGLANKCRPCVAAALRAWHGRPENRHKSAEYTRRCRQGDPGRTAANRLADRCRAYGITVERYERILQDQGGCCAMCGKTVEQNGKALAVDHDHSCCSTRMKSCGKCVRGLLCSACNVALGFIESATWQRLASGYLSTHGKG